jgi:predicted nucleic acid-binding protein
MDSVFLDSDVVLDLYIDREPHHAEALALFTHLKRAKVECYCSPIVIANTYYILSKVKNSKYALEKMRNLRRLVSIAPVGEKTIDRALEDPYKDFEDSIQQNCALENGIKVILTRNAKHFSKERISVMSPHEYLVAFGVDPTQG